MTLQLEIGMTYRSRSGEKVSILSRRDDDLHWPFRSAEGHSYEADGSWDSETGESRYDLVALWDAPPTFQSRVAAWMDACFGPAISADKVERNHRFLEEALELVQALGCSREECLQLVDYVFGRPVGEPSQEVGGVMVTLAALCLASGLDMDGSAETELARVWTKIDVIRAKQAAKPRGSVLPISPSYEAKGDASTSNGEAACASAATLAASPAEGWQPIETAPRDGFHLLLFRPEICFVGYYAAGGDWIISAPGLPPMYPPPTHWMPLPKPPAAKSEAA